MALRGRGARPKPKLIWGEPPPVELEPWQNPALSRVERIVTFIEGLPVTKGHLAGRTMKLLPFQRQFIEAGLWPRFGNSGQWPRFDN